MRGFVRTIIWVYLAAGLGSALGNSTDLDATFGGTGVITMRTGDAKSGANGVAVQSDGKIVVVGYSSDRNYKERFVTARVNEDGTLDNSFATNGVAVTATGFNSSASAVAIQSDGRIVVAGYSVVDETTSGFALIRYNLDGTLDQTFGKRGVVLPSVGVRTGRANAVAIQRDGKIVVGGGKNVGGFDDFALARYCPDGKPDSTFGIDGLVITSIDRSADTISAVALQPDEKIVAVGTAMKDGRKQFALARYDSTGVLDATFGVRGVATVTIGGGSSSAHAVILEPEGRIIAVGDSSTDPTERYKYTPVISLAAFTPSGTLDPSFGKGGIVTTSLGQSTSAATAAIRQSDGMIFVAGYAVKAVINSSYSHSILVARYRPDGGLDSTFGTSGFAVTDIGSDTAIAHAVATQSDGKIVVAGDSRSSTDTKIVLVRFLPTGAPTRPAF